MRNAIRNNWQAMAGASGFLLLLGIVGGMESDATRNNIPNGCVVIHEEPSGPEPDVSIWHRHIRCGTETYLQEFSESSPCGFVFESDEMVPASCATESQINELMENIRNERSGFRTWEMAQ